MVQEVSAAVSGFPCRKKPKAGNPISTPRAQGPKPRTSAYIDGLKVLSRHELSEAQVRRRLARKGHETDAVNAAVERLRAERAIDDTRVAKAIAHPETAIRRRGRLRVRRQIEQAGIAPVTARRAIDLVFGSLDGDALLQRALAKRLSSRDTITDKLEFQKLYRFLIGQGFELDRVMAILKARRSGPAWF